MTVFIKGDHLEANLAGPSSFLKESLCNFFPDCNRVVSSVKCQVHEVHSSLSELRDNRMIKRQLTSWRSEEGSGRQHGLAIL